jgi:hypothetical protein
VNSFDHDNDEIPPIPYGQGTPPAGRGRSAVPGRETPSSRARTLTFSPASIRRKA